MSVIQKFPIEKINKIRKILLLYIDKEIKSKNKINCSNSLNERFSEKDLVYQKAYSNPINLELKFSNSEDNQNNINQSQNDFNQNCYTFKIYNSLNSNMNNKNIDGNIKIIKNINLSYNWKFQINKMKHISKFEKNYIIIKDDTLRLKGKINCINYLISLCRGLKCPNKRKKCLSIIKVKKSNNEESKKETLLELKKKQNKINKKRNKNTISISLGKRHNSVINLNDNDANIIKKAKRRSLFYEEK